jgi:hypothetical protein
MGGTVAQQGDGALRLMVLVFGVAAALAGTFVVLAELILEVVKICNALGGGVDAYPAGGLRGGASGLAVARSGIERKEGRQRMLQELLTAFSRKSSFSKARLPCAGLYIYHRTGSRGW